MKKRFFSGMVDKIIRVLPLACVMLFLLVIPAMSANIIIDHTNWDWYDGQNQAVTDRVAAQKIFFAHASVGGNIMDGFNSLNTDNAAKYPLVQGAGSDTPPDSTTNGSIYDYNRANPDWPYKVSYFDTYINNGWHDTKVGIVMNKFCYIDQEADWTVYRDSMVALEAQYPNTKFIYWTMPLTTDDDNNAVLRALFNQNLRDWIATQDNKYFFDIADIQAWDPDGVHHTFTSGDETYEQLYADYSSDGGHLNETGSVRVAKGLYSLFGKIFSAVKNDFNSDGKPDILWRNTTTGRNLLWYMNGAVRSGFAYLTTQTDQAWTIVGTGDFNSDGKTDILWRNTSTGKNLLWYMNGAVRSGFAYLTTQTDQAWTIAGTGDFNGDGETDILWRNTSTGKNLLWYMNGAVRSGFAYLTTQTDQAWTIAGTGDFNGDGETDILWRNTSTGKNLLWYMNGAVRSGFAYLTTQTDQAWTIAGTGDFNGDGETDILWRNTSTGKNLLWYMNGAVKTGFAYLTTQTDQAWTIVGK